MQNDERIDILLKELDKLNLGMAQQIDLIKSLQNHKKKYENEKRQSER